MALNNYQDRIWKSNCLAHEANIKSTFERLGIKHQLVDALWSVEENSETFDDKPFYTLTDGLVTDNHFRFLNNSINVAPEFYSIYRCPTIDVTQYPNYKYNCLINRISGERYLVLKRLWQANMLDKGIISFNCDMREFLQHTPLEEYFKSYGIDLSDSEELYQQLPLMTDLDPDQAAMRSHITLVCETYCTPRTITFSEKIFRALQTPRPWLLICSPNSINVLRDYEFDVLDDVVDHSYDEETEFESRLDKLLPQLVQDRVFDQDRYQQAVEHNQERLDKLAKDWPHKLSYVIQSIGARNQS